jgi:hypothetical protein
MELAIILIAVQSAIWIVAATAMRFVLGLSWWTAAGALGCYLGATMLVNVIGTKLVIPLLF